jgi:hypothetical protein
MMSARSLPPFEVDSTAEGDRDTVIPDPPVRPALFTVSDPSELEHAAPESRIPTVAPPRDTYALDHSEVRIPDPVSDVVPARSGAKAKGVNAWLTSTAVSPGVEPSTQHEDDAIAILGSLDAVPRHALAPDQLIKLSLDHHAGFMLALVDGVLSFDTIVDVCGMKRAEALRVLSFLVRKGVIET